MGPTEDKNQKQIYFCFICGGVGTTKHHLVPKAIRTYRPRGCDVTIRCCRKCHDDIHFYFSHWELSINYNSEQALKNELIKRKNERNSI